MLKRWLKQILCFAMLVLLASCAVAPYRPSDSTVGNMSVNEARNVLVTQLKENCKICYSGFWVDTHIHCDGTNSTITNVRVTSNRLIVTDDKDKKNTFIFRKLPEIIFERNSFSVKLSTQPEINIYRIWSGDGIANALYVFKQNAIKVEKDIAEYDANFAVSLTGYRKKAVSNAALPEEANRYKVQAEGAVRDKEFYDAADFYAEALKIVPWWPAGRFNRALVLGETGEYGEAIREMKHYLQLVPDAPNARAAQDKIYDWERLDSKKQN